MIAITLLAIVGGSIAYRVDKLIDIKRFESDSNRLQSVLISTRTLSLNTQSDWRLNFRKESNGWNVRLICREDPDQTHPIPRFANGELFFEKDQSPSFGIDFYATGQVRPKGKLLFQHKNKKFILEIPKIFLQEENGPIAPYHPKDLE